MAAERSVVFDRDTWEGLGRGVVAIAIMLSLTAGVFLTAAYMFVANRAESRQWTAEDYEKAGFDVTADGSRVIATLGERRLMLPVQLLEGIHRRQAGGPVSEVNLLLRLPDMGPVDKAWGGASPGVADVARLRLWAKRSPYTSADLRARLAPASTDNLGLSGLRLHLNQGKTKDRFIPAEARSTTAHITCDRVYEGAAERNVDAPKCVAIAYFDGAVEQEFTFDRSHLAAWPEIDRRLHAFMAGLVAE